MAEIGLKPKIEKKTELWLGLLVLVLSLVYIFTSLGRTTWIKWIGIVFGLFLVVFLFVEGGVFEYFRKKDYKTLGFGDVIVWVTFGVAVGVLINTMLLFEIVRQQAPQWLISFSLVTGVTVGTIAGLTAILHIFTSRFK